MLYVLNESLPTASSGKWGQERYSPSAERIISLNFQELCCLCPQSQPPSALALLTALKVARHQQHAFSRLLSTFSSFIPPRAPLEPCFPSPFPQPTQWCHSSRELPLFSFLFETSNRFFKKNKKSESVKQILESLPRKPLMKYFLSLWIRYTFHYTLLKNLRTTFHAIFFQIFNFFTNIMECTNLMK